MAQETLERWCERLRKQLDLFQADWKAAQQHDPHPDNFPNRLNPADWWEQFECYLEVGKLK